MKLPKDSTKLIINIDKDNFLEKQKNINPIKSSIIIFYDKENLQSEYAIYFYNKNVSNISLKLKVGNIFILSYNYLFHSYDKIITFLENSALKLINRSQKISSERFKYLNLSKNEFVLFDEIHTFKIDGNKLIVDDDKIISIVQKNSNIDLAIKKYKANKLLMYISKKQHELELLMNVPKHDIKIINANTLWAKNWIKRRSISYSFNLSKQNKDFIDLTIIHELAHFFHQNHSKEFWNLVKFYAPNYKKINNGSFF
ncbi:YgjP-like metallopeptidase domain-containing protein [Mycoplasma elephantis]|uniref:YgjP-like metallopeptidase domain-containing protein n=1 Tax=Mycoplasma elephantis TaxID=114882 RepID=UPI00068E6E01|nr:YgjP-like metallopeptidase domain-containing protein [Mycoplasma elephantis]